jgi:plasmid stability protein
MSKMIQIRNVPDKIHRILKTRAERAQMNLSDFLLREMNQIAARPELDELIARIKRRPPAAVSEPPAAALRSVRESNP